jgi:ketosteroid isomerase-like protein
MTRVEAPVRAALDLVDAVNHRDLERFDRLVAEDCILESASPAPDGANYQGRVMIVGHIGNVLANLPELHLTVEELAGFGLKGFCRYRADWNGPGGPRHRRGVLLLGLRSGQVDRIWLYAKT